MVRSTAAADGAAPCGATLTGPPPRLRTTPPGPVPATWTCTCSVVVCESPVTTRLRDVLRPTANVTVIAPSSTAASVTEVRAGRANGAASPIVIGRGSRSRPSSRCAT